MQPAGTGGNQLCRRTSGVDRCKRFAACDAVRVSSGGCGQRVRFTGTKLLGQLQTEAGNASLVRSLAIPGYSWIASGVGDFAMERH